MNRIKSTLAFKISIIAFLLLLAAAIVTGMIGYYLYRGTAADSNSSMVVSIASTTAAFIDTDEYDTIISENRQTEYWHYLKKEFDIVKERTGLKYLYALNNDVDGKIQFVVEGQAPGDDPELICDFGDVLPVGSYTDELFTTLETGRPNSAGAHVADYFGTMVSGYAPIIDRSGNVIGVVGADFDVAEKEDEMRAFGIVIISISVAIAFVLGMIMVFYIRKKIGKPIEKIIDTSEQLLDGSFADLNFDNAKHDEITRLTASVNSILEVAKPHDHLTGAYNRHVCEKALEKSLEAAKNGTACCIALFDVDNLKMINDEYGHNEGDHAIREVASVIQNSVRENDIVCRYGGDEFITIFNNTRYASAEKAIRRMHEKTKRINQHATKPYLIEFSYGLMEIDQNKVLSVGELVAALDGLMYEQKRQKKDGDGG